MTLNEFLNLSYRYRPPPILVACCLFSLTVQYCVIADQTQLFDKIEKRNDPRIFLLCVAASVFLSLRSWTTIVGPLTLKPLTPPRECSFLPREQTEEWKGWMQAIILLYHYFGLTNVLPVYQVIRVLVGAYIFLTGYSHTAYFLKTNDFSLNRSIKTLLRLNLLSCVLAYALNKQWNFYYFPALTSFWYLVFLITLRFTRTRSGNISVHRVGFNLVVSFALVQLSLYTTIGEAVWTNLLAFLGFIGGPYIKAQEFMFRLRLDSIVPFLGACLAVVAFGYNNELLDWCNTTHQPWSALRRLTATQTSWIALGVITPYFLAVQLFEDKITSNKWHPFISIVPMMALLLARNASSQQRQCFSRYFRWLGSISLELYILQSHIWMTKNNKELLHLRMLGRIPHSQGSMLSNLIYCLDKLIITVVFLAVSHVTAHATKLLVERLAEHKRRVILLVLVGWLINLHWSQFTK